MAHHAETNQHLSHEELKFNEHTVRAGHFIKIDLFRSAREEYKAALEYKPGDAECLSQIDLMNAYISRDRKKVLTVVPIVAAIITVISLLV
jgi:hypothetical protein